MDNLPRCLGLRCQREQILPFSTLLKEELLRTLKFGRTDPKSQAELGLICGEMQ